MSSSSPACPALFTRGLSGLSQTTDPNSPSVNSPAEQRDDAKRNFLKTMRTLPTQHYWDVYFDRSQNADSNNQGGDGTYKVQLEKLPTQIESVQDFWRYANNTPVQNMKMRDSIYLFKQGFKPVWEDRRNINGGSWTFRVHKNIGPEVWTKVQLLAIGEELQGALEEDLRRRPLGPLQGAPHLHLAPRLVQAKVHRRHARRRTRGPVVPARRPEAQARQLLL
ncbi:hypothetical protein RB594_001799 [Gaeumannomyces avenae]